MKKLLIVIAFSFAWGSYTNAQDFGNEKDQVGKTVQEGDRVGSLGEKGKEKSKDLRHKEASSNQIATVPTNNLQVGKEELNDANTDANNKADSIETGFNKERVEVARAKNKEKKAAVKTSIKKGEATVTKAKDKIALAKEALEKDKTENTITEEEYNMKKARIEMIEQKTKALENKLIESKDEI